MNGSRWVVSVNKVLLSVAKGHHLEVDIFPQMVFRRVTSPSPWRLAWYGWGVVAHMQQNQFRVSSGLWEGWRDRGEKISSYYPRMARLQSEFTWHN